MSKFKVPSVPATTNKTVRFPNDIIERVEKAIINQDSYFSAFVIAAVRKALEEVESEQYSSKE
nr:YlcI/YnfO family protein [Maliibacterium massiliense]